MKNLIARFIKDDSGQDLIEYALLAGFISVGSYTLIDGVSDDLDLLWTTIGTAVRDARTAAS